MGTRDDCSDEPPRDVDERHEDAGDDPEDGEGLDDGGSEDGGDELPAVREAVARAVDMHHDLYFRVLARGGAWTRDVMGVHADAVRGAP